MIVDDAQITEHIADFFAIKERLTAHQHIRHFGFAQLGFEYARLFVGAEQDGYITSLAHAAIEQARDFVGDFASSSASFLNCRMRGGWPPMRLARSILSWRCLLKTIKRLAVSRIAAVWNDSWLPNARLWHRASRCGSSRCAGLRRRANRKSTDRHRLRRIGCDVRRPRT